MQRTLFCISLLFALGCLALYSCSSKKKLVKHKTYERDERIVEDSMLVCYVTGSKTDVSPEPMPGLLLMGGGKNVDSAVSWFLKRSGGGDIVVLRARGANSYNQYLYRMEKVNSVETVIVDSRVKARFPSVAEKIRNAEALFIAGGDQWEYIDYWKDTPVEDAINYLLNEKKVPVGGTGAGISILGSSYFSAEFGTISSADALPDPYNYRVLTGHDNFLAAPYLQNTIAECHYTEGNRMGRHVCFLARMMNDLSMPLVKGIGVDEMTAVCVNEKGLAKVYGSNSAYFLQNQDQGPETCLKGKALNWSRSDTALRTCKVNGTPAGKGSFDLSTFTPVSGGRFVNYSVSNGVLTKH